MLWEINVKLDKIYIFLDTVFNSWIRIDLRITCIFLKAIRKNFDFSFQNITFPVLQQDSSTISKMMIVPYLINIEDIDIKTSGFLIILWVDLWEYLDLCKN